MRVGVVVQARMSSSRFPGKVLHKVAGKPMLGYLLDGLSRSSRAGVLAVATSGHASDDPIAKYCDGRNVRCVRGPLEDVAARFLVAIDELELDGFVRICGDSPLLDYRLVDLALELFVKNRCDMVTNVLRRTFPKGQSVEVVRSDSFHEVVGRFASPEDKEHVTRYFYAHPERFSIHAFESGRQDGPVSLVVDTEEDMRRFEGVVNGLKRPHWEYGWQELADIAGKGAVA